MITATLAERTGSELVYVPYKAAPQALADLLSGQVDMTFADVAIAVPQMKAGKAKRSRWLRTRVRRSSPMCRPSKKPDLANSRSMPGSS